MAQLDQSLSPEADAPSKPVSGLFLDRRLAVATVVALLLVRIPFSLIVPPNGDEAFYWLWGLHPQWSYRDHGPLVGWLASAGQLLFGWSIFALRFPTLLTTAAAIVVLWAFAGRLAPRNRITYFWTVTAVYLCSPLMQIVSANVYPDHVLVPLLLLALYLICDFLLDWRAGERRFGSLYLGALTLGLAGLAKYNAVFVGLALLPAIAVDPRLRTLFRTPQLYLAGALCLAVVSPIIIWNWAYDFPSVRLHAIERYGSSAGSFNADGLVAIAGSLLTLGPFLLWPLFRFLTGKGFNGPLGELHRVGIWTFGISTAFMFCLTLWSNAAREFDIHWNVVAYLPFILAAPLFLTRRWMLVAHIATGGLAALVLALVTMSTPLPEQALGTRPRDVNRYGMDLVAAAIARQQALNDTGFVASGDWATASRVAFAVGPDITVTSIASGTDQFDLWYPAATFAGQDAIVALKGKRADPPPDLPFANLTYLETVTASRFGIPLVDYTLYLGTGYQPQPSAFDREESR
jgi:hypothetical protein